MTVMRREKIKISQIVREDGASELCYRVEVEACDGSFRFPIVISGYEAFPLINAFDGVRSARPQTHDLLLDLMRLASLTLEEVHVAHFERGVFYSRLVLRGEPGTFTLDSRTSDALILAVKCEVPVYVSQSVLDQVIPLVESVAPDSTSEIRMLEQKMHQLVELERYEEAAVVRDRIKYLRALTEDIPASRSGFYES